ncbi:MAG: four helix bundle protein [Candidatus Harrisonbacteria bacterium]|nr:four helix bundle protein [Candidatus Harrisonbacteria bacterium]
MAIETYHENLKKKMDEYAHFIYKITKEFPREEIYGITSQIRRAGLSVVLNYVEGYARGRNKVYKNFLEISYGSLKESKYLLHFSLLERYIDKKDYEKAIKLSEEIGAMLWGIIRKI